MAYQQRTRVVTIPPRLIVRDSTSNVVAYSVPLIRSRTILLLMCFLIEGGTNGRHF